MQGALPSVHTLLQGALPSVHTLLLNVAQRRVLFFSSTADNQSKRSSQLGSFMEVYAEAGWAAMQMGQQHIFLEPKHTQTPD